MAPIHDQIITNDEQKTTQIQRKATTNVVTALTLAVANSVAQPEILKELKLGPYHPCLPYLLLWTLCTLTYNLHKIVPLVLILKVHVRKLKSIKKRHRSCQPNIHVGLLSLHSLHHRGQNLVYFVLL